MELIIIGIVTAANFLILKIKAEQNRWTDLAFDIIIRKENVYTTYGI